MLTSKLNYTELIAIKVILNYINYINHIKINYINYIELIEYNMIKKEEAIALKNRTCKM